MAPQKKRGRKRIKEMWCGNHGPGIVWGEEVSEENKERSLFLEVKTLAVIPNVRLKQTVLAPVGEVELLVIKLVRELAAETVDMVEFGSELAGEEENQELQLAMIQYEERIVARRKEGAKFKQQLGLDQNTMVQAAYDASGEDQRREELERSAKQRGGDVEMAWVKKNVRGTKRKMLVQVTAKEKGRREKVWATGVSRELLESMMVNAIFISMGREAAAKEKQKRITDMWMAGAAKVRLM